MPVIAIADDESSLRAFLGEVLRREGYLTAEVGTGSDLLKMCLAQGISLAIVDLSMPDVDGFQVLRELKMRRLQVPTLVISGLHASNLHAAQALGADIVLPKPFSKDELLTAVRRILN